MCMEVLYYVSIGFSFTSIASKTPISESDVLVLQMESGRNCSQFDT